MEKWKACSLPHKDLFETGLYVSKNWAFPSLRSKSTGLIQQPKGLVLFSWLSNPIMAGKMEKFRPLWDGPKRKVGRAVWRKLGAGAGTKGPDHRFRQWIPSPQVFQNGSVAQKMPGLLDSTAGGTA